MVPRCLIEWSYSHLIVKATGNQNSYKHQNKLPRKKLLKSREENSLGENNSRMHVENISEAQLDEVLTMI